MSDKAKVIIGVVVVLTIALFPVWRTLGSARETRPPELDLPKNATECIEATDYMIGNHMDLLNRWRDAVVREGGKEYTSMSGETHVMSLTGTCLECHTDSEAFCDRCHEYADVKPTCWNCHVETKGS